MKRLLCLILLIVMSKGIVYSQSEHDDSLFVHLPPLTDIIQDIYAFLSESEDINYESLQEELIDIASHPIDINHATWDDLAQLPFLSGTQIDNILLYIHHHPLESIYELRLIEGLQDYEIRDLCPFIQITHNEPTAPLYAREVFHYAKHEAIARVDVRNAEAFVGDPVYAQLRYKFNYHNRVQFGLNLRRYPGEPATNIQHSEYVQLNDIWHFKTIVAGNYQAQFGQGLVVSNPFRVGKTHYVLSAGSEAEGLKRYTSTDGQGLHGIGTTLAFGKVNVSAWYSLSRTNDSLHRHIVGANLTVHHKRFKAGITAIENIYSDTLRYYYDHAAYNQNYFRGIRQAVIGANLRWNFGIVDMFAEVATAQNRQWGVGLEFGTRIVPINDIGLLLLYRYYSPTFDNTVGYAFSESSRINDENGLYLGMEIKRLRHWRFSTYGDVFRFAGIKYGIPYAPSWGYDAVLQADYLPNTPWNASFKLRAKEKAKKSTIAFRGQFGWEDCGWKITTRVDGNLVIDSTRSLTYGVSLNEDIQYRFATKPLVIQLRLQAFDARKWDNRIYLYENDVLYANSTPATYGLGGRFYLNLRWQIIKQLGLYLKVSETIYASSWQRQQGKLHPTQTDIHLMLRATF